MKKIVNKIRSYKSREESQTKQIAKHGLIITYIFVISSIALTGICLLRGSAIPDLAGTMFIGGLGFFTVGIGGKVSKGFVTRGENKRGIVSGGSKTACCGEDNEG
ncbi:hypothetical protein [Borrelia sp. RT1S]|uniref:hypothetical protein n=1 Tax=Borrelia sp. RT1S TaxID=2898580 RepID=UPI001E2C4298|nr:hypothetical protein [Borrelia sp. RT1S]UGQ17862.1 hypothetical protein LSO05_05370 [Borrelia sp. RT1S]